MRNNAAYLPESPIVYIILPKSIRNRASFAIFVCSFYTESFFFMYIFNTTYHIESDIKEIFIAWLREVYIPTAMHRDELSEPQLCRVIAEEDTGGDNFSLQFHVADPNRLETWYDETGADLDNAIREKFGDRVLGFNTLLEIID